MRANPGEQTTMRQQQLMMPDIQASRGRGQRLEKEQAELLDYYLETLPNLEDSDLTKVAFNATNELQFTVTYQAVYDRVKKMGWKQAKGGQPVSDQTWAHMKEMLDSLNRMLDCTKAMGDAMRTYHNSLDKVLNILQEKINR